MPRIKVKPRLHALLKERNMTQIQLAELANVPQGSISRFDQRQSHDANHVFSIAFALGLSVEDLFIIEDS